MSEKPWKEMTPAERSAHMAAGKARAAAERAKGVPLSKLPPQAASTDVRLENAGVLTGAINVSDEQAAEILGFHDDPNERDLDFFAPVELDDDEVMKIRAWAMAEAKKEQLQRKRDAMKAAALAEAREQMGLVVTLPEDAERARLAEMVVHTVNLPEGGGPDGVRLDQMCYRHGLTYTVPRAVFETIIDIENKAWMAEALFDGKARNHYNKLNGRFQQAWGGGTPMGTRSYHAGA